MLEAVEGFGKAVTAAQLVAEPRHSRMVRDGFGKVQAGQRTEAYASVTALVPQTGDEVGILRV